MKNIYQAWRTFYKSSKKNTQTRITVLLIAVLLSSFVFGQEKLPVTINNIGFFPPPRSQSNIANCSHFALSYYLKSAIRNRYYGLNPLLKANQFNQNFVWNQNINPIYRNSNVRDDFEFMKDQGCATAADFDFDETNDKIMPSLEVREKALAFKSKAIHSMYICRENGLDLLNEQMQALKDSLSRGICFVSSMYIYNNFFNLNQNYDVYNCEYDKDKLYDRINHAATIIGYNDTIKTANGRGAFLVLNSSDSPGKAIFYFPYEWYYSIGFSFNVYFLEEDFNSNPAKLTLNLKISNLVTSPQISEGNYFFTDTAFYSDGKKFDYLNYVDWIYRRNEIKLLEINKKKISVYDQTRVFFPFNSEDGSYQILKDLSDLSNPEDFKSLKVLFSDPISATYVDENDKVLYSYEREAKGVINQAYINFIGLNKKIVAKIENLPDTTIIIDNFFSIPIGWYSGDIGPWPYNPVKSCTSVLKRKLITFSIADNKLILPVANAGTDQFVNKGTVVLLDGSTSFDLGGNALTYKWIAPAGITLSSTIVANPTFTSPEVTANKDYTFSLVVNNGITDSPVDNVVITVSNVNKVPFANAGTDQSLNEGATVFLDGSASSDPDGNPLIYKWTAPAGITLNSNSVAKPTFFTPEVTESANYTFSLVVNDGLADSPADQVVVTVNNVNKAPVANAGAGQFVYEETTVSLDGSSSSDPDGNPLTYKWIAPAGITLNSTNKLNPTFTAPEVTADTNYTFSLVVNDGTIDSQADHVVITVKPLDVSKVPVAIAGPDQTINEGSSITLDGTSSSDPNNDILTYHWTVSTCITRETPLTPEELAKVPLSPEAFIKYSPNGLETKVIKAKEGTRVWLTFIATDEKTHILQFTDKALENIFVGFSKAIGGCSLNFLAPSVGSYDFVVDGTEKGTLVIESSLLSSSTASKPTFTAPEVRKDTTFIISLVVNDGTLNSIPATVKVTILNVIKVGVSTLNAPLFKIYPNPTTGIVNIEFTGGAGRKTEVLVMNLVGAEVFRKELASAANYMIDLSNQVSGIYLLKVIINNQQYISKIVVSRQK